MESVHQCVENCTRQLSQSQNYVQNELSQFQERLQRGILLCQDRIKEKVGPNPGEAELRHYKNEFESCAVQCVDYHINQLPSLMQKITKNLEHWQIICDYCETLVYSNLTQNYAKRLNIEILSAWIK